VCVCFREQATKAQKVFAAGAVRPQKLSKKTIE